ncbi:MAG: hypothetical protein KatS3mg118_0843 [Paracoccaceae bacterium]|nr:MAG: arylmalonate decarboxylase [Alphaproteobacteria bacterium]GIX12884.1 MAG: hypothetical protein KatS3mg118_0843 [Paracoccaceae bacterium]
MRPCVGLIVPPAAGEVPPEPPALFPHIDFIAEGLGLPEMTPEGYDSVITRLGELAARLKARGARAVSLMGTSLSFYRGAQGNADALAAMSAATGLPVTTMTDSVLQALIAVGAQRVAVATAYTDPVNRALCACLEGAGFAVAGLRAMNLRAIGDVFRVSEAELLELGHAAVAAAPGADALLISCGGLRTLPVVGPLEARHGLPVVSSATAGAWGAARLVGDTGRAPGHGALFAR